MDGYMYNLDPYHQASAAPRYQPSYASEMRSTYGLPSTDPYARVPIDPFSAYGARAPYQQSEPRYISTRPRPTPPFPHNLGAKKVFKQTQKGRFSTGKERLSLKKDAQGKSSQTSKRIDKPGKDAPLAQASLAKETQELHSLFRSGVDALKGRKPESKTGDVNGAAQKRKADTTPTNNFESGKKQRKKKSAKDRKMIERPLPKEEELKDLELQRGLCQGVSLFFGFPDAAAVADVGEGESDGKGDESKEPGNEAEKDSKVTVEPPEEKKRLPEEEKEIEAKSFKFFSGTFTEHQELRNLYVEKCSSGSFECLVCRSANTTKSKTFWNLVSLVIHTKMVRKMEGEHIGFGRAISAVLGWDHANIPKVPCECRPVVKHINQGKE